MRQLLYIVALLSMLLVAGGIGGCIPLADKPEGYHNRDLQTIHDRRLGG
jgi:hypothetical protein